MSKNIILGVCNKPYLNHYKSLFGHIRSVGNYFGDLGIVYNGEISPEDYKYLKDRNVHILNVPECYCYFAKFYVFDTFFKNWEKVLYLDADIWVKNDINCVFEMNKSGIFLDPEEFRLSQHFKPIDKELYDELNSWCPLDRFAYNTSSILYTWDHLDGNETSKLFELAEKYQKINKHLCEMGSDQSVVNILLYQKISSIQCISFVQRPANNPLLHCTNYYFKYSGEYYDKGIEIFNSLK